MTLTRLAEWIERHLVAAALAEEGLHADARRACAPEGAATEDDLDAWLASRGVRMYCAVLSPAALMVRR